MKVISKKELKKVLELHLRYLKAEPGGQRANLSRANLSRANLSGADLSRANLSRANLSGANLSRADLARANLSRANLSGANLSGANLPRADLSRADLSRADLSGADLSETNLFRANLFRANLFGANLFGANLTQQQIDKLLPQRTIVPELGSFIGYKKLTWNAIATLYIPRSAKRMGGFVGRKCRASKVKVLAIEPVTPTNTGDPVKFHDRLSGKLEYVVGKWVKPDSYDDNPLIECSTGIHFFITKQEAIDY